ncbi:MAG: hypothetical protein JRD89_16230 [Deltaproteobacteria bacterium]|nr:hypothetical protein [Deltaproteobacteria bacterium]
MPVFSIAKKLTIPAGAEGTTTLYTVRSAQKLTLRRALFHFPTGSSLLTGLAIRRGIYNVCPEEGLIYGDHVVIELADDSTFDSGSSVDLYYRNEDTANDHQILVIVEGELVTNNE